MEGPGSRPPAPRWGGDAGGKPVDGKPPARARAVDPKVYEELGFARCPTCGSIVLEGVCVQCNSSAPAAVPVPAAPPVLRQEGYVRCSKCSSLIASGARFCGSCGESVHASSLALARVRDLRSRLETLK